MKTYDVQTPQGVLHLTVSGLSEGPVAVLLHGAFRTAASLQPLAEALGCDAAFAHLPGHGGARLWERPTVDALGAGFASVLGSSLLRNRPVVFVGESVGGLVALRVATFELPNLSAVVAIDPPLVPARMDVADVLARARALDLPEPERLTEAALGPERCYYDLLTSLTVPAHVVTGQGAAKHPCLMDVGDAWVVERMPRASLHRIQGGHDLAETNPAPLARLVEAAQRDHAIGA